LTQKSRANILTNRYFLFSNKLRESYLNFVKKLIKYKSQKVCQRLYQIFQLATGKSEVEKQSLN
jgi:hypothetical protein